MQWLAAALVVAGCGSSGSTPPTATPGTPSPTVSRVANSATPTISPTWGSPTVSPTVTPTQPPVTALASETSTLPPTPTKTIDPSTPTVTATVLTPTPTPTFDPSLVGPIVTYLGMVRPDGCRIGCFASVCACPITPTPIMDDLGRQVFLAQGGGRGLMVVEGHPGSSGLPVGSSLSPENEGDRPDVQILSSRSLGNGSPAVCDKGPPPPLGMGGGIPAVEPPDFGAGGAITDAMTDFSCRFAVQPSREDACTLDNFGNFDFLGDDTTIQFCNQVASVAAFPSGDTLITVRLRDVAGNLGPPAEVVVRNLAASPPEPGE